MGWDGTPAASKAVEWAADRLVATALGPVAVIPDADRSDLHGIGVDGTGASLSALDFAAREAPRWGEPLNAVHAWLRSTTAHDLRLHDEEETVLLHLVVGNHGRRWIARFLLGSVSRVAVMTIASPIVVVRAAEQVD